MKRKVLVTILVVTACLGAIAGLEVLVARSFRPVGFDPTFRQRIIRENPDIILVGNSTLGSNIDRPLFQKTLSELAGKSIRVSYLYRGGMHTAWFYLILRNHIAHGTLRPIPVVFVDYEDYFIRPEARTATGGRSEMLVQQALKGDEESFFRKVPGASRYFARGFPYLYSRRYQVKRWVTAQYVTMLLRVSGVRRLITHRRFAKEDVQAFQWLLGTVFKQRNFRSGQASEREIQLDRGAVSDYERFTRRAESSFLPDILAYRDRFPLFFVLSNSNPQLEGHKRYLKPFAKHLDRYLRDRGAFFLDLNPIPELQEPGLMHDSRHFSKGRPREINTRILARELVRIGIVNHIPAR